MRLSKSATVIAALAMAATGAITMSQAKAKASTIATVTTDQPATLYGVTGFKITNRALAPHTLWAVGDIIKINDTVFYQVATDKRQ